MKHLSLLLCSTLLLAGCQGGGSDDTDIDVGNGDIGSPETPGSAEGGDWTRGFVESFDPAKVEAVRNLAGYVANNMRYTLRIDDHPVYSEGQSVDSNALLGARVDYAHSTGLTGAGQIVAMVDDGIRATHEQFSGKTVTEMGLDGAAEHGTAVASVIAGNGETGEATGVAPGADLLVGAMSFETGVDWSQQTSFLEQAAEVGAIAVNNSWSITSSLDEESAASVFSSGSAKNYIEAMKAFAQDGIIVFAMQNEYDATSAHVMAGIPLSFPELEDSFITAINVIPVFDEEGVISATRISAGCLETAAYCMAANGMLMTASDEGDDAYKFSTGASFAAPQIAGSLALLAEAFPDLSPQQLRARLLASADNGWFETTGVVEFADGITHGYNEEFGHGFLNLRDALLPIGSVGVPMADASGVEFGTMELGRAAISGGAMSGDAIAASLANIEIVAVDQLDGVFRLSGDAVAGVSEPVDLSAFRLASLSNGDLKAQRLSTAGGLLGDGVYGLGTPVMRELDALSLSGNFAHPVTAGAATLVEMIDDDTGSAGIRVKQGFSLGSGQLVLGFDARHEEGSVMGMTAPGYETAVEGSGYGMQFGLAHPLGSGFGLRIEGELGRAEGTGGGMIQSFDDIRYDSLRVSLDRGGVFDDDDILTFFASRPAVITSGSAKMTLPVAASGGVVSYAEHGVDLAPDARQLDLGVEYAAGLNAATELRLGAVASMNHGHAKSARDFQALASLQMRF